MPSSVQIVIDELDLCLNSFRKLLKASDRLVADSDKSASDEEALHWVRQQISARLAQIEGLRLDLESGLSPLHLGYASADEMMEIIEDIKLEIAHLERVAKSITEHTRVR